MILFWIITGILVLSIIISVIGYAVDCDEMYGIGKIMAILAFVIVACMLIIIVDKHITATGERAANVQRYNALIYKAQTESIRDEFGIVNKEYIDEIQAWNEEFARYQVYSQNLWISIFYPEKYEGCALIELESIEMKE